MPKIAIYVPKEDLRQIESWRHKINFSKVFRRALQREIESLSRGVDADTDRISAAAQFYKERLRDNSGELSAFGRQLGVEGVLQCQLSPQQVCGLLAIADREDLGDDETKLVDDALGPAAGQIGQFLQELGIAEQNHPTWRASVLRGYLAGVAEAWKRVCEKM